MSVFSLQCEYCLNIKLSVSNTLILGRGPETEISDRRCPKQSLQLEIISGKLFLKPLSKRAILVHKNSNDELLLIKGRYRLHNGDSFAVFMHYYWFTVKKDKKVIYDIPPDPPEITVILPKTSPKPNKNLPTKLLPGQLLEHAGLAPKKQSTDSKTRMHIDGDKEKDKEKDKDKDHLTLSKSQQEQEDYKLAKKMQEEEDKIQNQLKPILKKSNIVPEEEAPIFKGTKQNLDQDLLDFSSSDSEPDIFKKNKTELNSHSLQSKDKPASPRPEKPKSEPLNSPKLKDSPPKDIHDVDKPDSTLLDSPPKKKKTKPKPEPTPSTSKKRKESKDSTSTERKRTKKDTKSTKTTGLQDDLQAEIWSRVKK